MHFILFFNLKQVKEDVKQFIFMVKKDPVLGSTPLFILSESIADRDVMDLYRGHITNYILKPEDLDDLNRVLDSFKTFWFDLAELP